MKVSRTWLQRYFVQPLPAIGELADALTFHVFEIDEIAGDMLDVKVLPDRAAYGLSHRGVAHELSAILKVPLKSDPLREPLPTWPQSEALTISVDTDKSIRQMGALVRGVKVGPSPEWLKSLLESVGQRSINNIVDATNFVTLNIGQPLHAFDAKKISDGNLSISVRESKENEKMITLSGEEYTLPKGTAVIANAVTGEALDVAGVKGGKTSAVDESTTDLYISVANFDGTAIRKTAQALKLFTDASLRFQNKISPELVAYGMRDILALIAEVAGGELEGVVDIYPVQATPTEVSVSVQEVKNLLGAEYSEADVSDALSRLAFSFKKDADRFVVAVPFERNDLQIREDLIEEVGRIVGYEHVAPVVFQAAEAPDQKRFKGIERIKDFLVDRGFTEISTQSFAKKGDIRLANPLDVDHPYLRTELAANLTAALVHAKHIAPLVLAPKETIRLFEIGTVFPKEGERLSLVLSEAVPELEVEIGVEPVMKGTLAEYDLSKCDLESYGAGSEPKRYKLGMYQPFSAYPFVLRDVAVWVPEEKNADDVRELLQKEGGSLLTRIDLFDTFTKEGRTSYAFRLVFQSDTRTLTDVEVNEVIAAVTTTLNAQEGWQVR